MTDLTESERLFAMHCATKGVSCERLDEDGAKVPDFSVGLGQPQTFAEIKQLDLNDHDRLTKDQMASNTCDGGIAPSRRVRDQIAKAYKQLKPYAAKGHPCLVVLYNNAGSLNYIDNFTVTTAMFGTFGVRLGLGADRVIRQVGQGFGGKRKLTKNTCRGISAVCVISDSGDGRTSLTAYHNPFASVPIDPAAMALLADRQFKHENPHSGMFVALMPDELEV